MATLLSRGQFLGVLWLAGCCVWAWRAFPTPVEDGYIVCRWANLLAQGHVTHGVTSATWGLLSAIGAGAGHVIGWQRSLGVALEVSAFWYATRGMALGQCLALAAAIGSPYFARLAVSGLEAPACVAAVLLASRHKSGAFALALLRLDTVIPALFFGWRWALAGLAAQLVLNLVLWQSLIPASVTSKALSYGVHPFAGHYWLTWAAQAGSTHSAGVMPLVAMSGFATLGIVGLAMLPAFLAGAPFFWWHLATSRALLAVSACRLRPVLLIGLSLCAYPLESRWLRATQDKENAMATLAENLKGQTGTVFLEPVGTIPYLVPGLDPIDAVGLVTPWVAARRVADKDWWAGIVRERKPDWLVVRIPVDTSDAYVGQNGAIDLALLDLEYEPFSFVHDAQGRGYVAARRKKLP